MNVLKSQEFILCQNLIYGFCVCCTVFQQVICRNFWTAYAGLQKVNEKSRLICRLLYQTYIYMRFLKKAALEVQFSIGREKLHLQITR